MKNKLLYGLFAVAYSLSLFACGGKSGGDISEKIHIPDIDNKTDLYEYTGELYKTTDDTYYLSKYIDFIMEVSGYYQTRIPFYLDSENENLRIFDNMYFYKGDFFQLMSSDYKYIWATLSNEETEYLTPLREQGLDIQVNVNISGIYKITLDITTMVMNFEYKSEITTPYYYPFDDCEIGVLVDGKIKYDELVANPDNEDELYISNYNVISGKLYTFFSRFVHTSMYKLTINPNSSNYVVRSTFDASVVFNYDGAFNIYVNRKTYELRVEVADPSTLVFHVMTLENGEFVELTPKDPEVPYIFEYEYEATIDVGGYGVVSDDVPTFYNKAYEKYVFDVEETDLLRQHNDGSYYFKTVGNYLLTMNILELTLRVELINK